MNFRLGFEAQIRPRSGLALKHAITLPNSPATIDPGYRGEIRVILLNLGSQPYQINTGDRIARMVVSTYSMVDWFEEDLGSSGRGTADSDHRADSSVAVAFRAKRWREM